jgi:hypothetical protein
MINLLIAMLRYENNQCPDSQTWLVHVICCMQLLVRKRQPEPAELQGEARRRRLLVAHGAEVRAAVAVCLPCEAMKQV